VHLEPGKTKPIKANFRLRTGLNGAGERKEIWDARRRREVRYIYRKGIVRRSAMTNKREVIHHRQANLNLHCK